MRWTVSFLLCFVAFAHRPQQAGAATNNKCTNEDGTSGECVPYNLCSPNNSIITDGLGMIDIRGLLNIKTAKSTSTTKDHRTTSTNEKNPCASDFEVCCGTSTSSTTRGCGVRNNAAIDFRVEVDNNNVAQFGEFPWMVAILREEFETSTGKTLSVYTCGGSLIHPKVVLTAAQCVLSEAGSSALTLKIRAGEWDTQTKEEIFPHQEREVTKIISHDNYYSGALYNDIALLILKTPVDDAYNIGIVCLPPANIPPPSSRCFATGWGKDKFGKAGRFQSILKRVELPIIEHHKCQTELRKSRLGDKFELHKSFTCAGGESKEDMCRGDGGSPLVCSMPDDPNHYMQSGIVSWGIGCGDSVPGVYANVGYLREWIDEQLINNNIDMTPYAA